MNSEVMAQLFQQVKKEGSVAGKKALLEQIKEMPDSLAIIQAIFDPRITYGVNKKLPTKDQPGTAFIGDTDILEEGGLLHRLATRDLTGNAAQAAILEDLNLLAPASAELLICILQQNLRAGFGVDMVNEVWGPNTIPTFKVMLAHPYAKVYGNPKKRDKVFPARAELKYDGVRGFAFSEMPGFFSRTGKPLETTPELREQVAKFFDRIAAQSEWGLSAAAGQIPLGDLVIDGELTSLDGAFAQTVGAVRSTKKEAGKLGIKIIDVLSRAEFDSGASNATAKERREILEAIFELCSSGLDLLQLTESVEVENDEQVQAMFQKVLDGGGEGLIVKPDAGIWEAKRSENWLKLKAEDKIEAVIVEVIAGDPLSALKDTTGAVRVKLPSGVLCKVSGMTMAMRDALWEARETIAGTVCEVEYHEFTPDGSLRHPRIHIIRDDKPTNEVNPDGL